MITMADVAKEAGVSVMTVSRVATGTGYVKEGTRKKVLRAMKALNYKPKKTTLENLEAGKMTLALIVPDITNPFYTLIARGMEDVARKNGYRVFIANTDENLDKESEYIDMCISLNADGVLIAPVGDPSAQSLQLLAKATIPFVLVDRLIPGIEADTVKGDITKASFLLVDHLLSLGHRRIAIITGPLASASSRERLEGYRQALSERQIAYDDQLVVESVMTRQVDPSFLEDLLSLDPAPTAIFAANLFQYAHIYHWLSEHNIAIPTAISLVCFGNSDTLIGIDSPVTCAIQPTYNFGSLGTQLLLERIEGISLRPRKIILEADVSYRNSTCAR